jgi:hypothetical protein
MREHRIGLVLLGLVAAGVAIAAGTKTLATVPDLTGTNIDDDPGAVSLDTVQTVNADGTPANQWQRDEWTGDGVGSRLVQLRLDNLMTATAAAKWVDTCLNSVSVGTASSYSTNVRTLNGSNYRVNLAGGTAKAIIGGTHATNYAYDALATVRSVSAQPTAVITVPEEFGTAETIQFLTLGAKKVGANASLNYTVNLGFEDPGDNSTATRAVVIPIKSDTKTGTVRNPTLGTTGTSVGVDYTLYTFDSPTSFTATTTSNPACNTNSDGGDEVFIANPIHYDATLAGFELRTISFSYTEIDGTLTTPTDHLGGPFAVTLDVSDTDYDSAFTYRGTAETATDAVDVISANASDDFAFWYEIDWAVSWPTNDTYSDVFLSIRCGEDDGGPDFGASTWTEIVPAGLRSLGTNSGTILLGDDACGGEFVQVSAEIVAAFDDAPVITQLDVSYDLDADEDGVTSADLFRPNSTQAPTVTRVTAATGNGSQLDCVDTNPAIYYGATEATGTATDNNCSGNIVCYTDLDGDDEGSSTTQTVTLTAGSTGSCTTGTRATNNVDCNDVVANSGASFNSSATETPGEGIDYDCNTTVACYLDADGDGYGVSTTTGVTVAAGGSASCAVPASNRSAVATDCNDTAVTGVPFNPNATETAGAGIDHNCNSSVQCYADADADGDGDDGVSTLTIPVTSAGSSRSCSRTAAANLSLIATNTASSSNGLDCDDTTDDYSYNNTNGGRLTETVGAGIDYTCDARVTCYTDGDGDGDGLSTSTTILRVTTNNQQTCVRSNAADGVLNDAGVQAGRTSANSVDCNDTSDDYNVNNLNGTRLTETTGAGIDYNCNGSVACYSDLDGDNYGNTNTVNQAVGSLGGTFDCAAASGAAAVGGDCNETIAPGLPTDGDLFYPTATETTGLGYDYNCDAAIYCYTDTDGDDFGTSVLTSAIAVTAGSSGSCTSAGRAVQSGDCVDTDDDIYTGAPEADGAGIDNDCDGIVYCYVDDDRDGEGDPDEPLEDLTVTSAGGSRTCDRSGAGVGQPTSSNALDCNDAASNGDDYNTSAVETPGEAIDYNCDAAYACYVDTDKDGFGNVSGAVVTVTGDIAAGGTGDCDARASSRANDNTDCNDAAATTFPGATEASGVETDRNCSGNIVCFTDTDGDNFGTTATFNVTVTTAGGTGSCDGANGSTVSTDCNDTLTNGTLFNPNQVDQISGTSIIDYNCDGSLACYEDADGDGQGSATGNTNLLTVTAGASALCRAQDGRSALNTDCNDADEDIYLGAAETTGLGIDADCDATITCYVDSDGDGYGSVEVFDQIITAGTTLSCDLNGSSVSTDCRDCVNWNAGTQSCSDNASQVASAFAANPGGSQVEALDAARLDENCDGVVACYPDADRDGFGAQQTNTANAATWALSSPTIEPTTNGIGQCLTGQGHATTSTDCHDDKAIYFPGATHHVEPDSYDILTSASGTSVQVSEIPGNAFDDNCDGLVLCFFDSDEDGWGIYQELSNTPGDFKEWTGTRQLLPADSATYDRYLGGTYTCDPTRNEAPLIIDTLLGVTGPTFDCADNEPLTFPGASEADGVGDDNNCDAEVQCFIDADGDSYGGSTSPFPTPNAEQGYVSGIDGPALCTTANGFADNGDDCHDNNQFANPGPSQVETPGHSPSIGETVSVPGVGTRQVGPNASAGQYDYCGDGSSDCYNAAFDDDCDGVYDCYLDEDGDTFGTGIVSDAVPVDATASDVFTCEVPTASNPTDRRAAVGGSPGDTNYDCHPSEDDAYPGRSAGEITGNVYDDNCDNQVACFEDLDADSYGTSSQVFITWVGVANASVDGYDTVTGLFDCDDVADMAALRGTTLSPEYDCHDNFQYANPGMSAEVAGHTPASGGSYTLPNGTVVTVGAGNYDLCGDGSTTCYGRAFDDDCDDIVHCYVDTDGDGVGGALTTTEAGILPGSTLPWDVAGDTINAYSVFTCDTVSAAALNTARRSSIGGNVGSASHDCHDGNAGVYPTTSKGTAPVEEPGHTTNLSDASDSWAFDENCDGVVDCFEDQDQDDYGTAVSSVTGPASNLKSEQPSGTSYVQYDCTVRPNGVRTSLAGQGGARGTAYYDSDTYDCHDNNADANPGNASSAEIVGSEGDIIGGIVAAYDEDCDGFFSCWRDRDDDGFGTEEVVQVSYEKYVAFNGSVNRITNGSTSDDGYFDCDLPSTGDLFQGGVTASNLHWRGGGAVGTTNTTFDCHDNNALANPDATSDPVGNSTDSLGNTDRAFDDDCDGTIVCYQNTDGDLYGTFEVSLGWGATTNRTTGTIAVAATRGWFDCDSSVFELAGRGGVSTDDFDCHDDDANAYPGALGFYALAAEEDPRDATDNDCDGTIWCFEDLDDDGYGTAVVELEPSDFPEVISPSYDASLGATPENAGMLFYVCGREAGTAAGLSTTTMNALGLDSDEFASVGGARASAYYEADEFDCHDNNADAHPGLVEVVGSAIDPFSGEVVAFDEDCNGSFRCFRDRDNDGIGTASVVAVSRDFVDYTPLAGGSTDDDGVYNCDLAPPGDADVGAGEQEWDAGGGETHLSGIGGGTLGAPNFDCHDENANAYPGLAELPGNSTDHLGVSTFSYDEDCDGLISCYRDFDDDGFGTYVVVLENGTVTSDASGTIAKELNQDYYRCDNNVQNWAGLGGITNPDQFDCHDLSAAANPGLSSVDEVFGDAYDNDCDGTYLCYQDLDNDGFGTISSQISYTTTTGFDHPNYATWTDANLSPDALVTSAASIGFKLFPCGASAATAAGLVLNTAVTDYLNSDRVAEVGGYLADGVTPSTSFDCHDDWEGANPGLTAANEVVGDPFDNDCNGFFNCWSDRDGDGFGNRDSFTWAVTDALADTDVAYDYDAFPFTTAQGDPANNVLPAFPVQAFDDIVDYRLSTNLPERTARAGAVSGTWYDCRGVDGGSPAGGEDSAFYDCHDDYPAIYPGFRLVSGSVSPYAPEDRTLVSGPTATCDGPVMCVIGSGDSVRIETTTYETCTAEGGSWRCFESAGATDNGETAGDSFDNDCDGFVLCYENMDGDLVGTVATLDSSSDQVATSYDDGLYSCRGSGEAEYTGDCHDNLASVQPPLPGAAVEGDDLTSVAFMDLGNSTLYPEVDDFDDLESCEDGVILCHDASTNLVYDRYEQPNCDVSAPTYRCYDLDQIAEEVETGVNQIDQNCDGIVSCFYDQDGDGYGRDPAEFGSDAYRLASIDTEDRVAIDGFSDAGWFVCDDAVGQRARDRGTAGFDCNDVEALENPGGIESTDLFSVVAGSRETAFDAVGNAIDENCDGAVLCWTDADNDGFGGGWLVDDLSTMSSGDVSSAWVGDNNVRWTIVASTTGDCVNPAHGNPSATGNGLASTFGDCHDTNAAAYPGAAGVPGNTFDNNCDGIWTCYEDLDGDTYGSAIVVDDGTYSGVVDRQCTTAANESAVATDCLDDNDLTGGETYPLRFNGVNWIYDTTLTTDQWVTLARLTYPDAVGRNEIFGDGIDGDCNGYEWCYIDADGDSFPGATVQGSSTSDRLGRPGAVTERPSGPNDSLGLIECSLLEGVEYFPWPLSVDATSTAEDPFAIGGVAIFDCDDTNTEVYPGPESQETYYDGVDGNCDNKSDYDKDGDGYDDRTATAGRGPCSGDAAEVDPVLGCGIGTDCNDTASGYNIHPAPYDRVIETAGLLQATVNLWVEDETRNPAAPITRYEPLGATPFEGIHGDDDACESGNPFDSDCDGNLNTSWDCWFDLQEWSATENGEYAGLQIEDFQPVGALSRELFTNCIQSYGAGDYYVDRSDPLDFAESALTADPDVVAQAVALYDDFEWDPDWTPPAFTSGPYYTDIDLDTEGNADAQGVYLCNVSVETTIAWLRDRNDCDDTNETINARGIEICDRADNNCDGEADEFTSQLTEDLDPNCVMHYMDNDNDTWGMRADDVTSSNQAYCLCPRFEALTPRGDGTFEEISPPPDCPHYISTTTTVTDYGHQINAVCYVQNTSDCNDLDPNIRPTAPGDAEYEIIDGVDNNCDDKMPLIELDCDEDNAYPYLPFMSANLLADPEGTPIYHADEVGLAACSSGSPPTVLCWGERLPLSCDGNTGLWTVSTTALVEYEKFTNASASLKPRSSDCVRWDCDDQCASRCAGIDEGCDGLDNDCNGFEDEVLDNNYEARELLLKDVDGVPDPIATEGTTLGWVDALELDLDADNRVSCAIDFQGSDNQSSLTNRECREYSLFDDQEDLCNLTVDVIESEKCNGFHVTLFNDADEDLYRECGTQGVDPSAADSIYVLVFSQGDIDDYNEDPIANRMSTVVPLIPPRLYRDEVFDGSSVDGQVRECDVPLNSALEGLIGELPSGDVAVREKLLELCVLADTCRVEGELRATQASQEQANDNDDAVEERPDDLVPAPPVTGINQSSDYCEALADARCSVVELTLNPSTDQNIYDTTLIHPECTYDVNGALYHPEQAITRTVWSQEQIAASRKLVVEYECYRMFGTFGCEPERFSKELDGYPTWQSPYQGQIEVSGGFFALPDVPDAVYTDFSDWWMHMNRYSPVTVKGSGTIAGCWGDPRIGVNHVDSAATIGVVGGDCIQITDKTTKVAASAANRGHAEGPGDLLGRYLGVAADCATCQDGIDNNCNQLLDRDDPACAQCFVGQGSGCGCSAATPSGRLGRTATPALLLWVLLLAAVRRRERT